MSTDLTALTAHQFFQGLCWPQEHAPAMAPEIPPGAVAAKVDALCHILQTLSAADSGWPAYKPQTPEYLLPYVTDELEELLEALPSKAIAVSSPADGSASEAALEASPQPLATLSSEWVWAIAACLPTAMLLLEGVAASSRDRPAAYGVRLVPVLIIQTEKADYTLDLAAQSLSHPTAEFEPSARIQLLDEVAAPIATAADWQRQIQARSLALAPHLQSWYVGQTVNLGVPGAPWFTAQARLELRLVPLTVQVSPSPAAHRIVDPDAETAGLPTARIWPADSGPSTDLDLPPAQPSSTPDVTAWTWDTELRFEQPAALTAALQATQRLDSQQQVIAHWQTTAAVTPMSLLETVMQTRSAAETWGLTVAAAPLSLAALCTQVKWLWIRAHRGEVALMSGLQARRLRSGQPWQPGIVTIQGNLVFLTEAGPVATLDIATAAWTPPTADLQASDLLQFTAAPSHLPAVGPVSQLTQTLNQRVRSRSPLLASLMDGQPITLWSPHDELFPETPAPKLQLQFHVGLTFFASLP